MSDIAVEDHYFEYSSMKYFRDDAENIQLGSYGAKHAEVFGPGAYLEVQNLVKREYLTGKVTCIRPLAVDWDHQSAAAVEANGKISYFVASGQGAVSGSYSDVKQANLKLMKLVINEGPLRTILNQDAAGALKSLSDEGANGRIVNQIWVGLAGTIEEQFTSALASGASVSATVEGASLALGVQVKGTSSTHATITLNPGTTFAYGLCKVSNWDDHRTRVADLSDDYYGMK